jgi:hypothetical protein
MKYYKVVRVLPDGKFVSAVTDNFLQVEYKFDTWAYSNSVVTDICKDYGIFVFTSPKGIFSIADIQLIDGKLIGSNNNKQYAIFECEIKKSSIKLTPYLSFGINVVLRSEKDQYYAKNTIIVTACKLTRQMTVTELSKFIPKFS